MSFKFDKKTVTGRVGGFYQNTSRNDELAPVESALMDEEARITEIVNRLTGLIGTKNWAGVEATHAELKKQGFADFRISQFMRRAIGAADHAGRIGRVKEAKA